MSTVAERTPTTVTSSDGTSIAYERVGTGPALILVDGALCYRASGPSGPLAKQLRDRFTVYTYDRRGRGKSGSADAYAADREVDDLDALIRAIGGTPFLYGISSGAALALEAANRGLPISKLALYEAPFVVDDSKSPTTDEYVATMSTLATSDRSAAVRLFLRQVGVPAPFIAVMRVLPMWSKLTGIAHTLPYDTALTAPFQVGKPLPDGRWSSATLPTIVIAGAKSPAWMRNAQVALAQALPNAEHRVLRGQTHMVKPAALAPVLAEFFAG